MGEVQRAARRRCRILVPAVIPCTLDHQPTSYATLGYHALGAKTLGDLHAGGGAVDGPGDASDGDREAHADAAGGVLDEVYSAGRRAGGAQEDPDRGPRRGDEDEV